MIRFFTLQCDFFSTLRVLERSCEPGLEKIVGGAGAVAVKHFEQTEVIRILQEHLAAQGYYSGVQDGQWHDPAGVRGSDNFNSAFTKWLREMQAREMGDQAAHGWLGQKSLAGLHGKVPENVHSALASLLETQVDGRSAYSRLHRRNEYHASGIMVDGTCIAHDSDISGAPRNAKAHADAVDNGSGHAPAGKSGSTEDPSNPIDNGGGGSVPSKGYIRAKFEENAQAGAGTRVVRITVEEVKALERKSAAPAGRASGITSDEENILKGFDAARASALKDAGYDDARVRLDAAQAQYDNGRTDLEKMRDQVQAVDDKYLHQTLTVFVDGKTYERNMAEMQEKDPGLLDSWGLFGPSAKLDAKIYEAVKAKYAELQESDAYKQDMEEIAVARRTIAEADRVPGGFWHVRREELQNAKLAVQNIETKVDQSPIAVAIKIEPTKDGQYVAGKIGDAPAAGAQGAAPPKETQTPAAEPDNVPTWTTGTPSLGNMG
ncbi:MAG: hypothetical protein KDI13_08590 [Alphaproteobacteria bacterium]|nr:hypothetical protein [Alphaproteobacteria bacterium]